MAAWALSCEQLMGQADRDGDLLIDLREDNERMRDGVIAGSVHAPYTRLGQFMESGGMLRRMAADKRLVFYCAFGERSALAVKTATDMGLENVCHLVGGIKAWTQAGGAVGRVSEE